MMLSDETLWVGGTLGRTGWWAPRGARGGLGLLGPARGGGVPRLRSEALRGEELQGTCGTPRGRDTEKGSNLRYILDHVSCII